jgi:hypothetical protein
MVRKCKQRAKLQRGAISRLPGAPPPLALIFSGHPKIPSKTAAERPQNGVVCGENGVVRANFGTPYSSRTQGKPFAASALEQMLLL